VIRDDRFLISRKPYAVNLGSLRITDPGERYDGTPTCTATLDAIWFRRRKGVTVACIGHLWDIQAPPTDAAAFLAAHTDGRYGGTCFGRWDGAGYWGAEDPDVIAEHLGLLRPMLAGYPAIPPSHDGWWHF